MIQVFNFVFGYHWRIVLEKFSQLLPQTPTQKCHPALRLLRNSILKTLRKYLHILAYLFVDVIGDEFSQHVYVECECRDAVRNGPSEYGDDSDGAVLRLPLCPLTPPGASTHGITHTTKPTK